MKVIIFDIDGTLAKRVPLKSLDGKLRSPFPDGEHLVGTDAINPPVVKLNRIIAHYCNSFSNDKILVYVFTGRTDICYTATKEWLNKHNIHFDMLLMRTAGDYRADSIIKHEFWSEYIYKPGHEVLFVIDDRNQVVDMWRSIGLTCLQVDYGNF